MSGSIAWEWPDFWAYYVMIENQGTQIEMFKQVKEIYDSVSDKFKDTILEYCPEDERALLTMQGFVPQQAQEKAPAIKQRSMEEIRQDLRNRFQRRQ